MVLDTFQSKPFIMYCTCSVRYSGRAESDLEKGQFVIVHKPDGVFLILGSTLITPRNYMGPGSKLSLEGNTLKSTNKKNETIIVDIESVRELIYLDGWSKNKITLSKSEKDLVLKIADNIEKYIPNHTLLTIEYQTSVGSIDIYVEDDNGRRYVIEVKRAKASLAACSQISRYLEVVPGALGYLMAPGISANAQKWCDAHNIKYITVDY